MVIDIDESKKSQSALNRVDYAFIKNNYAKSITNEPEAKFAESRNKCTKHSNSHTNMQIKIIAINDNFQILFTNLNILLM